MDDDEDEDADAACCSCLMSRDGTIRILVMILPVPFSLFSTIILFDLFKFSRRKEVPFFKIQKRKNGTAVLDGIVSNSADCEQNLKDTLVRERDFKKVRYRPLLFPCDNS